MHRLTLTQKDVQRHIYRLLAITGILVVATLIGLSLWMSRTVDAIAQENAGRMVAAALRSEQTRLSQMTQDYADWETAYDWVIARDDGAVYENLGTGTTESGFSDYNFIYGPDGSLWYAYEYGGERSDLTLEMADMARPMLDAIAQTPVTPYQIVSGFAQFDGDIALLAAGRIQPYDASDIGPSSLPVMINVVILSDDVLAQVGADILIEDLHAAHVSDANVITKQTGQILNDVTGTAIAVLTWTPPSQGREMLSRNLWITALVSLAICFGHFVVARISFRQTQAFLAESQQARTDSLTGLLNRKGVDEYVAEPACATAIAAGRAALIYLDLDDFKAINDRHGHHAGDTALTEMAKRLQSVTRPSDTIARIGGDEFVILIKDSAPDAAVRLITSRLHDAASRPARLTDDIRVCITASIGAAVSDTSSNWRKLMLQADAAMYRAKRAHKSRAKDPKGNITALPDLDLATPRLA